MSPVVEIVIPTGSFWLAGNYSDLNSWERHSLEEETRYRVALEDLGLDKEEIDVILDIYGLIK